MLVELEIPDLTDVASEKKRKKIFVFFEELQGNSSRGLTGSCYVKNLHSGFGKGCL